MIDHGEPSAGAKPSCNVRLDPAKTSGERWNLIASDQDGLPGPCHDCAITVWNGQVFLATDIPWTPRSEAWPGPSELIDSDHVYTKSSTDVSKSRLMTAPPPLSRFIRAEESPCILLLQDIGGCHIMPIFRHSCRLILTRNLAYG